MAVLSRRVLLLMLFYVFCRQAHCAAIDHLSEKGSNDGTLKGNVPVPNDHVNGDESGRPAVPGGDLNNGDESDRPAVPGGDVNIGDESGRPAVPGGDVNIGKMHQAQGGGANKVPGQDHPKRQRKFPQFKLSEVRECREDVQKYCNPNIADNNFEIIDCLQSDEKVSTFISIRVKLQVTTIHIAFNAYRRLTGMHTGTICSI